MLQTTTTAMIASGAVLAFLIIVALLRRRRRHSRHSDLPALLYFAGTDPGSTGGVRRLEAVATRPNGTAGWPASRGSRGQRAANAVAWAPAPDQTVQLLPGGLRPEGGGEEIRFDGRGGVRRFTLGRGRGAADTHIQLSASTTSRMHAWMEFSDGQWRVGRLSQTNDVVVNGTQVEHDSAQPLRDGDRIELGDVAFTFHHPGQRAEASDGA